MVNGHFESLIIMLGDTYVLSILHGRKGKMGAGIEPDRKGLGEEGREANKETGRHT